MNRFSEIQTFANAWVVLALLPLLAVCLWGMTGGDHATIMLVSSIGTVMLVSLLSLTMKTTSNENGIKVVVILLPFVFRKKIKWKEIDFMEIRKYDGLYEFGGFNSPGIRYGKNGLVGYRIRGDVGIFLYLKDGTTILIGTNKPRSASALIKERAADS